MECAYYFGFCRNRLHSIHCPTDFSEFSERVIRDGYELAAKFRAEVQAVILFDANTA